MSTYRIFTTFEGMGTADISGISRAEAYETIMDDICVAGEYVSYERIDWVLTSGGTLHAGIAAIEVTKRDA